ncbi:MAG: LmbE family N-acetylglucosaminyl deacetylase [Psychroserpens sp.]|jgi:LmbE family N-acetylglucosaminyl deacetylase
MANVLVVVAHADDEALGCGATIAKHAAQGDDVTLLVMTDGVSARMNTMAKSSPIVVSKKERKSALQQSADILGIKHIYQAGFPDNKMDGVELLTITQFIEKNTENVNPEIIYTHSLSDLNIDHRLTAQAVLTAFRPLPASSVKTILSFEVLSSTEWQFGELQFSANWFVDVSDFYDKKISALQCYQEEMREFPHPRSFIAVEALAKLRGATLGKRYCEAFQLLRHQS